MSELSRILQNWIKEPQPQSSAVVGSISRNRSPVNSPYERVGEIVAARVHGKAELGAVRGLIDRNKGSIQFVLETVRGVGKTPEQLTVAARKTTPVGGMPEDFPKAMARRARGRD